MACSDEAAGRQFTLGSVEAGLSLRVLAAAGEGPWRDLELVCDAQCNRFEDRYAASGVRAWLSGPTVESFAHELAMLVETCRGSASVEALSPGNLALTVWNLDVLGHFAIRYQLGSASSFLAGVAYGTHGGFELSLTDLESLLRWLRALADEGQFGNE